MQVDLLVNRPDLIPELASQLVQEWKSIYSEVSIEYFESKLNRHLNSTTLPIAWIAYDRNTVLGTASLRIQDHDSYPQLSPWLGGVYVNPAARRNGIGTILCSSVETKAKDLGHNKLYLFTLDKQRWYQNLGWQPLEPCTWLDRPGSLMSKTLLANPK
jgi:N-acetylglutamate synthase-like GNAT family acetyltransferase